jgi:hypothetical protein
MKELKNLIELNSIESKEVNGGSVELAVSMGVVGTAIIGSAISYGKAAANAFCSWWSK